MRVIIVDDCAADRELYRTLLNGRPASQHSLEFLEAPTAAEGLELCRAASPDCVLVDYQLPDMTGLEFLSRLKSDVPADGPDFAVVMITGTASDRVEVEALKAGAQDYLSKHHLSAERLKVTMESATQKVGALRALKAERDRLARSLAEKDVLLLEAHHRFKNNLQTIASLLEIQASALPDNRLATAMRVSRDRVEAMALVHDQLNQNRADLAGHARLLAKYLGRSYGIEDLGITLDVAVAPLPLAIDRAMLAGLILNELISNALKHAFPGNRSGLIRVTGALTGPSGEAHIALEVQDDGVGLRAGWDLEPSPSRGLRIVKALTRQLQGSFECNPRADIGTGTVFRVIFPTNQDSL